MSTSKIGRAIKARDVVTPGYTDRKSGKSNGELRRDLDDLYELIEGLEAVCEDQSESIKLLNNKISKLEDKLIEKQDNLIQLQTEFNRKERLLSDVNMKLSKLEVRFTELEKQCEDLKTQLEEKKNSKWSLFKEK